MVADAQGEVRRQRCAGQRVLGSLDGDALRVRAPAEHGQDAAFTGGERQLSPVADGGEAFAVAVEPAPPAAAGDVGKGLHIRHGVIRAAAAHAAQQAEIRLAAGEALLDGAEHIGVVLLHRQA